MKPYSAALIAALFASKLAVANDLKDMAVVARDGVVQDRMVLSERSLHSAAMAFPQRSAALDVGEEEGDGTGGERRHHGLVSDERRQPFDCLQLLDMIWLPFAKVNCCVRGNTTGEDGIVYIFGTKMNSAPGKFLVRYRVMTLPRSRRLEAAPIASLSAE